MVVQLVAPHIIDALNAKKGVSASPGTPNTLKTYHYGLFGAKVKKIFDIPTMLCVF